MKQKMPLTSKTDTRYRSCTGLNIIDMRENVAVGSKMQDVGDQVGRTGQGISVRITLRESFPLR